MSGDCCNEIRQRLAEIEGLINSLPRVDKEEIIQEAVARVKPQIDNLASRVSAIERDAVRKHEKPEIIKQSIAGAENLIIPTVIYMISQAVNGLKKEITDIGAVALRALGTATRAAGDATLALSRIASLFFALISLAMDILTLKALGYRIDTLEALVDQAIADASSAFGLASQARRIGERAFGIATTADGNATTAKSTADGAYSAANEATRLARSANYRAESAESTASRAQSTATTAQSTASAAQATASRAQSTATTAQSTASAAQATASRAESAANTANSVAQEAGAKASAAQFTANTAQSTATTAQATALRAESAANTANTIAQTAEAKANAAAQAASTAQATASRAEAAAQTAQSTANAANVTANGALGLAAAAMTGVGVLSGAVSAVGATAAEALGKATQALNRVTRLEGIVNQIQKGLANMLQQIMARFEKTDALILGVPLALAASAPFAQKMTAVATAGTCNASQPGGCIDNAINRNNGNLFNWLAAQNALNTSGLAAGITALSTQIAGVAAQTGTILLRLGNIAAQIGGLVDLVSNKFTKLFKALGADRLLNLISAFGTIHNAYMLSSSLTDTFFSILDNTFNLLIDAEGVSIDTREIIGGTVENWIKGLIGVETFTGIKAQWKAFNRIYQSAANIVNTVRTMLDSTREILEWTGENVGKIGNALRRWGTIAENAFPRMPERLDSRSIWVERLENLQDAADGLEMVSSEVLDIKENLKELQNQRETFQKNLQELPPIIRPDNKPVADREAQQKASSPAPNLNPSDMEADS